MSGRATIRVEAPARLHLGLLDLRGDLGRRFGGAGMALETPSLLLEATPAPELIATGADAERVLDFARRFLAHHRLEMGARMELKLAMPAHAGLGSGTQLALATARALAALAGLPGDAGSLATAVARARRSAVGTWVFQRGGFILEGGRRTGTRAPAPLLLHRPVPGSWRCVLAIPALPRGLSGAAEEHAFRTLPPPPTSVVHEISHLVLMLMLPSLVEGDLAGFGRAVTRVQRLVGECFRPAQGAPYAHPLVAELIDESLAAGAAGAGQSSWGPTVYALTEGDAAAQALVARLRARFPTTEVLATRFNNAGARLYHGAGHVATERTATPAVRWRARVRESTEAQPRGTDGRETRGEAGPSFNH